MTALEICAFIACKLHFNKLDFLTKIITMPFFVQWPETPASPPHTTDHIFTGLKKTSIGYLTPLLLQHLILDRGTCFLFFKANKQSK
jgi:hypothetical protein